MSFFKKREPKFEIVLGLNNGKRLVFGTFSKAEAEKELEKTKQIKSKYLDLDGGFVERKRIIYAHIREY